MIDGIPKVPIGDCENTLSFPSEEHADPSSSKTLPTHHHAPQMNRHAPREKNHF